MSAVYCGSKRSYFEEIPSPPSAKRFRCYSPSNSPAWTSPSSSLDQLRTAFPHLELTVLVKALEENGSDLNAALKSLYSMQEKQPQELIANEVTDAIVDGSSENPPPPPSGDDWVELLVREMTQSTSTDDAKARATRVLEALEKMLSARAREEAVKNFHEQMEALEKDNTVLKRAVAIQYERQKAIEDANQQLELLKQHVIPQFQEKLRTLEVSNYALKMHLQQVEHGNSMPGRFNPDVF